MPQKLYIIHFSPIEGYPPILNLLDYFSSLEKKPIVTCVTTIGKFKKKYTNKSSSIHRFGSSSNNKIRLWLTYLFFNLFSILLLTLKRPKNVMYYETISSFPAYVYKKYINKKANIFIHYHEYTTKEEYLSGSPINRFFYLLEQQVYKDVKWISHTNEVRLNKFLKDNDIQYNSQIHKLSPNYPSKKWGIKNIKWDGSAPIKFVFVGYSVDPSGCFIKELIDWLSKQKQKTTIDIYCVKKNSLPIQLIGQAENTIVSILDPVAYQDLPPILRNYHIGLILYRGLTPNYIHNAPNKLFEYLSCELDVWFPKEMKGCYPYITNEFNPKVLKLDFNTLDEFNLEELINIKKINTQESIYYYENIYDSIYSELV